VPAAETPKSKADSDHTDDEHDQDADELAGESQAAGEHREDRGSRDTTPIPKPAHMLPKPSPVDSPVSPSPSRRTPLKAAADELPYVTLSTWDAMTPNARRPLLKPSPDSSAKFNDQKDNENIEWALWSWNPVTGCLHDCPYCYARDIANRFYTDYKFEPTFHPDRLAAPFNTPFPEAKAAGWMGHRNVFVCSMADLFGRWVPKEWIDPVLDACRAAPKWNFLFLTKFPARMAEFDFPANAWAGTSVDQQARVRNAEKAMRKVNAPVKWLSCEPLIEPLAFSDIGAFDWIVLGGASKSAQTPEWYPPRAWVNAIEAEAEAAGVKVYEKSNLLERIRRYPGVEQDAPLVAPEALRYLPPAAQPYEGQTPA
jgi:protein gp37